jgi:hypothetical protein
MGFLCEYIIEFFGQFLVIKFEYFNENIETINANYEN